MRVGRLFGILLRREVQSLRAHRFLLAGWLAALGMGCGVALLASGAESILWMLFQLMYYILPLAAVLGTIMIVRLDLAESPLLAFLPGPLFARVLAKAAAAMAYLAGALVLALAPALAAGLPPGQALTLLAGGLLVAAVFSALGVVQGFRSRHEVRAYLGGLVLWAGFLLGSGACAYAAHLLLESSLSAPATLFSLMANPLESFRILVFFGLGAVPMNPQTHASIALWWMAHPLVWLVLVSLPYLVGSLGWGGWRLRERAHQP